MTQRLHVIACGVLALDIRALAARRGIDVALEFLPGGLHDRPSELRVRLQEAIDRVSATPGCARIGRIAIGYGLCGRGAVGLHARSVPLVLPRVNDCIALLLGSAAAYREQFAKCPGTYYVSAGWVEERAQPQPARDAQDADAAAKVGAPRLDFAALVEKHGRENAEMIRQFLSSWQRNYQRAAFIDTGASSGKYAAIAKAMAEEFGWRYEELPSDDRLLAKLLTQEASDDEVLVVPPHHVTVHDPIERGLKAVPVWRGAAGQEPQSHTLVFDDADETADAETHARLGLGIDAGGTYTDAVIYDFAEDRVLQKAKAPTTKWDYAIGIDRALDQLDPARLARVDLASVSTTLATNAIVEGRGQKAGLLIMPPYGLFDVGDIAHQPLAVLRGRLEIDGRELEPVDAAQVRRKARAMLEQQGVAAFAVAGYASHANPAHELQVKEIVEAETGLGVTCGHELSDNLNYRVRAITAALNARIIPCLEDLIDRVRESLARRGIEAPVMSVKSDGSLVSAERARKKPIGAILSGPAASVAGASYLAKVANAIVVDIGGTTTDTAALKNGAVHVSEDGAIVGGWKIHVRALEMRTLGLGGDSVVARVKGELRIGPERVAPVAWLAAHESGAAEALDWLERNIDRFDASTRGMDLLALNDSKPTLELNALETRVVAELAQRPKSVAELALRLDRLSWEFLPLERLETHGLVQRGGLTPTDLLHATDQLALWDAAAARRLAELFSKLFGQPLAELAERVFQQFVHTLTTEILKKQLDEETDADELDRSPTAQALLDNLLRGGDDAWRVRVALRRPLIGIGAPVHFFLPRAAALLETEAIIPPDADVANAIGAITSSVFIQKRVEISPSDGAGFQLHGLPGAPAFANFDEAHQFALDALREFVREAARAAGTSQRKVEITVRDRIIPTADGGQVFLGRVLEARLSGRPDLARLTATP